VFAGQGWVGWRNDTKNGKAVEIKFEFDKVREFNAVHIYCNNQFTKDVQVSFFSIFYTVKRVTPFQSLCALKIMHVLIRERLKKTRNGERPIKRSAQPLKG
jgi:hypothetical protein